MGGASDKKVVGVLNHRCCVVFLGAPSPGARAFHARTPTSPRARGEVREGLHRANIFSGQRCCTRERGRLWFAVVTTNKASSALRGRQPARRARTTLARKWGLSCARRFQRFFAPTFSGGLAVVALCCAVALACPLPPSRCAHQTDVSEDAVVRRLRRQVVRDAAASGREVVSAMLRPCLRRKSCPVVVSRIMTSRPRPGSRTANPRSTASSHTVRRGQEVRQVSITSA